MVVVLDGSGGNGIKLSGSVMVLTLLVLDDVGA